MGNEYLKIMANTLDTSLDSTQKNATDIADCVQQVLTMSDKELHVQIVTSILANDKLELSEQLALIHCENADYEQRLEDNTNRVERMQKTKTENVDKSTGHLIKCALAVGGIYVFFIFCLDALDRLPLATKNQAA